MALTPTLERLVPSRRVCLDGLPIAPELDGALARVVVDMAADAFNLCELLFSDPGLELAHGGRFEPGTPVMVELGHQGRLVSVFDGEVVAVESRFTRDRPPGLVVRCYERLHRLALEPKTRSFVQADLADIVRRVAHDAGLAGEAPHTSRDHVLQANETDFAFLRRLAARIGHQLFMSDKKIVVAPPPRLAELSFAPGEGVKRLDVRMRSDGPPDGVAVRGWDPVRKQPIVASHGAASDGGVVIDQVAVADTDDALAVAKAAAARLAARRITASGELVGEPRVVPGRVLSFERFGEPIDGRYEVESCRHTFDRRGYRLSFHAARE